MDHLRQERELESRLVTAVLDNMATCTQADVETILNQYLHMDDKRVWRVMNHIWCRIRELHLMYNEALHTEAMRGKDANIAELDRLVTLINEGGRVYDWFNQLTIDCQPLV